MKIDVNPIIEVANDIDKQCMLMRGIKALYVVRYPNGDDLTVKFDAKGLEECQPNRTVSEMLKTWEEGIIRRYNTAKTALKTGLHPIHIISKMVDVKHPNSGRLSMELIDAPKPLSNSEIEYFKSEMAQLKEKFGEIKFYKIC